LELVFSYGSTLAIKRVCPRNFLTFKDAFPANGISAGGVGPRPGFTASPEPHGPPSSPNTMSLSSGVSGVPAVIASRSLYAQI